MDIDEKNIKQKIAAIKELNDKIEILLDKLDKGQEVKRVKGKRKIINLTAERRDELLEKIDGFLEDIEKLQAEIEMELVNRSLEKDDMAKIAVDEIKTELNGKIDKEKEDIENLEQLEQKQQENEKNKKINELIDKKRDLEKEANELAKEKYDLELQNDELQREIDELAKLEKENGRLTKKIDDINKKLKDRTLSQEEREALEAEKNELENNINENKAKIGKREEIVNSKQQLIDSNKQKIQEIEKNQLEKAKESNDIIQELISLGITDPSKIDEIYNNNVSNIAKNEKMIEDTKDSLPLDPDKANDMEYIKSEAKKMIESKLANIKKMEDRVNAINEKDFVNQIKNAVSDKYKGKAPASIDEILEEVIEEKTKSEETAKENKEKSTTSPMPSGSSTKTDKGGNDQTVKTTPVYNVPTTNVKKEPNILGRFFRHIKENYFSKEFKEKRLEFAQIMYPELEEKELKEYVDENSEMLNTWIRNGITAEDIQASVDIQEKQRKERMEKIDENDFLKGLKLDAKTDEEKSKRDDYIKQNTNKLVENAKKKNIDLDI